MAGWWKNFPWRMIQTNLRQIDMEDINAEQFVRDLQSFDATVVLFNAAGIIANYATDLEFEPVNEYLHGDNLSTIIEKCHEAGIRIMARMDFSKIRQEVYEKHPEWVFRMTNGKPVNYNGDIHVCPNGGYQQEYMFRIITDMFKRNSFDGIFYNMSGFKHKDYSYNYIGICHCENCKRKFRERFGLELPDKEDFGDPVYRQYRVFQDEVIKDLNQRLEKHVRDINPCIAINAHEYQRIESNTEIGRPLPLWQYNASSNTRIIRNHENTIHPTNTTVDFLGFSYRHVAVSPWLQELRLWQNVANLGGVDYYLIGRLDNHGDKSGYEGIKKVFKYAKESYEELKDLRSGAQVLIFHKELWDDDPEARGWVRALVEAHIPIDEMRISKFSEYDQLQYYKLVILPDIKFISDHQGEMLDRFAEKGGTVIASGEAAMFTDKYESRGGAMGIRCMGIKEVTYLRNDMLSAMYLVDDEDKKQFPHFRDSKYIATGSEVLFTRRDEKARGFLKLLPPQMFGPPERCYGIYETDIPAFTVYNSGKGRGIYIPWKPGAFFYREGYTNTGWFIQDLAEQICGMESLAPALSPMVETTIASRPGRVVIQLVNTSGHFGNSYYEPLPVHDIILRVPVQGNVRSVKTLRSHLQLQYKKSGEVFEVILPCLKEYEAVICTIE